MEAFPLQWPEGWPRTPASRRGASRFGKNLGFNQIRELQRELKLLGARDVVISSNVPIRNDGLPYASESKRRYDDPGVAVYFMLKGKRLSMARDKYWTPWENIRSLVLTIDGLRSMERHGGSTMMDRAFSGFTALPKPGGADWWEVLQVPRTVSRATVEAKFRELARERHSDQGGSDTLMAELNRARAQALQEIRA
jgi:hypothetical protein